MLLLLAVQQFGICVRLGSSPTVGGAAVPNLTFFVYPSLLYWWPTFIINNFLLKWSSLELLRQQSFLNQTSTTELKCWEYFKGEFDLDLHLRPVKLLRASLQDLPIQGSLQAAVKAGLKYLSFCRAAAVCIIHGWTLLQSAPPGCEMKTFC